MCQSCWEEMGSPKIWNEATRTGLKFARLVYDQMNGGAGGGLHIVLDDWNLEDDSIQHCIDAKPYTRNGVDYDFTLTPVEQECAKHLLTMTMDERGAMLACMDDCYDPEAQGKAQEPGKLAAEAEEFRKSLNE